MLICSPKPGSNPGLLASENSLVVPVSVLEKRKLRNVSASDVVSLCNGLGKRSLSRTNVRIAAGFS